jgi:TrmH family RNA methyltransferase
VERISSRQNAVVGRFRTVADSPDEHILLDGPHLLEEALASALPVEIVAATDRFIDGPGGDLVVRAGHAGARLLEVTSDVLRALSPVRQPSGIVAIGSRREAAIEGALGGAPQLVLMLRDVQDPGNVGAIIRAAEGCGATGIVTAEGTADPFGWKALRGSMGSAFRMPVAARQPVAAAAEMAKGLGIRLYAAVPRGGTLLPRCDLRAPSAVLLGGEGAGLAAEAVGLADELMTIPMRPQVESLNVATAAALIAYEAMRQREGWTA